MTSCDSIDDVFMFWILRDYNKDVVVNSHSLSNRIEN